MSNMNIERWNGRFGDTAEYMIVNVMLFITMKNRTLQYERNELSSSRDVLQWLFWSQILMRYHITVRDRVGRG